MTHIAYTKYTASIWIAQSGGRMKRMEIGKMRIQFLYRHQ